MRTKRDYFGWSSYEYAALVYDTLLCDTDKLSILCNLGLDKEARDVSIEFSYVEVSQYLSQKYASGEHEDIKLRWYANVVDYINEVKLRNTEYNLNFAELVELYKQYIYGVDTDKFTDFTYFVIGDDVSIWTYDNEAAYLTSILESASIDDCMVIYRFVSANSKLFMKWTKQTFECYVLANGRICVIGIDDFWI